MIRLRLAVAVALALGLAAAAGSAPAQEPAAAAAPAAAQLRLDAPDGRKIEVSLWAAADERGVVVFSHGFNSDPARYALLGEWAARGYTVAAPLHVDSLRHPQHGDYSNEQAFSTRIMDLAVVRGFLAGSRPGKPMIAAGHSFGSLMSLISAGAMTAAGPLAAPEIKAVVALSSAGDIPGLVTPETWKAIDRPFLMITGDADVVPGWVTDWRAHRRPFDLSPAGGKMLVVFEGGGHNLVGDADPARRDLIVRATTDFMAAHALGDEAARARLETLQPPAGVQVERR